MRIHDSGQTYVRECFIPAYNLEVQKNRTEQNRIPKIYVQLFRKAKVSIVLLLMHDKYKIIVHVYKCKLNPRYQLEWYRLDALQCVSSRWFSENPCIIECLSKSPTLSITECLCCMLFSNAATESIKFSFKTQNCFMSGLKWFVSRFHSVFNRKHGHFVS